MITHREEIRMVPQKFHIDTCSSCNTSIEWGSSIWSTNSMRIVECYLCNDKVCDKCISVFMEDGAKEYEQFSVCKVCQPKAHVAWNLAEQKAGRHDDIETIFLRAYRHPESFNEEET